MKVSEIIIEDLNEVGVSQLKNLFKGKPKGLAPSSRRAREFKAKLKANRAEAIAELAKKNARARKAAETRIKGYPRIVLEGIHVFVSMAVVLEYWSKLEQIQEEYENFLKGKPSIYDDMSPEQALATAENDRMQAAGALVIAALLAFKAPSLIIRALRWVASKTPLVGTAIKVVDLTPDAVKNVFSKFIGMSSTAALAFMATDAGKKFMEHWIMQLTNGTVGVITTELKDQAVKALEAADIPVPAALQTPIQRPKSEVPASSGELSKNGAQYVPDMKVRKDAGNKNIVVGGVKITGDDGFILPGMEKQAQHVRDKASALGLPDPLAGVKERP